MLTAFRPLRLMVEGLNPHSNISRALSVNPGTGVYFDADRVYARNLEVPAGGGVSTARGLAHAYGVFAHDGRELGLKQQTLDLLAAPAIPPSRGFYDECLKGEVRFSREPELRRAALVWIARHRWRPGLRRSGRRDRLWLCDQPDGPQVLR